MKRRPLGDILLDMENLRDELIDSHGLQWGDMIFELYGWLMIHRPDAQEEYINGGSPVLYYGPKEDNRPYSCKTCKN